MNRILFTLSLLVLLLVLTACGNLLADDIAPPPNSDVPSPVSAQPTRVSSPSYPLVKPHAADGEAIFEEKCAPCHGTNGLGDGPQADELPNPVSPIGTSQVARQSSPAEWYSIVSEGNLERFMPPFLSLSDRQRWDVVAYSYNLSMEEDALAIGEELYQANCANCHGMQGRGDGAAATNLSTPPQSFVDLNYMASRSTAEFFDAVTAGSDPDMPAFGDQLSETERWAVSDYLRSLTFVPTDEMVASQTTEQDSMSSDNPVESGVSTDESDESINNEDNVQVDLGAVIGIVVNASGGKVPSGDSATLYGFDEMQQTYTQTAIIEEDGRYVFDDVEMPPERVFMVKTDYEGVTYGSDIGTAHAAGMILDLPITVYDKTTDDSTLSIDRLHIFLEQESEDTLRVVELYVVSNLGEKTIAAKGEGEAVISYSLPPGATDLEIQDGTIGERYVLTDDGFGDTINIRPGFGEYQTIFTYLMPLDGKIDVTHPVSLPAEALVILAPDVLNVKGEGLQDAGSRNVQGVQYQMYSGTSLSPGDEIKFSASASSPNLMSSFDNTSSTSLVFGLGVLGLALIFSGVWLYRRNKSINGDSGAPDDANIIHQDDQEDDIDTVMDAIIALDDQYKAGELPEDAYIQRRGELKDRINTIREEQ